MFEFEGEHISARDVVHVGAVVPGESRYEFSVSLRGGHSVVFSAETESKAYGLRQEFIGICIRKR